MHHKLIPFGSSFEFNQHLETGGPAKESEFGDLQVKRFRLIIGSLTNEPGYRHDRKWSHIQKVLKDYNQPFSWTKLQVKPEDLHFELHMDERTLLKCEAHVTTPLSDTTRLTLKVGGSTSALKSVH